jgi:hypothetical protein
MSCVFRPRLPARMEIGRSAMPAELPHDFVANGDLPAPTGCLNYLQKSISQ